MENGLHTLRDLFTARRIFRVPIYQRAYAWRERQIGELLADLDETPPEKAHFLGTLLFEKHGDTTPDETFEFVDVVDGQQRLTTLVVLAKVLADRMDALGESGDIIRESYVASYGRSRLQTVSYDDEFFHSFVLGNAEATEVQLDTPSKRRLLRARHFLESQLDDRDGPDVLELRSTLERARVLTYAVADKSEAALLFETTNDRGRPLNAIEKLKSFLMHRAYSANADSEPAIDRVQQRFSDIYRYADRLGGSAAEDRVLQYHYIAFEPWRASRASKPYSDPTASIKDRVNRCLMDREYDRVAEYIEGLSASLRDSFAAVCDLERPRFPEVLDLQALGFTANVWPLLLKTYRLDSGPQKERFRSVARQLETFTFRTYGVLGRRSNTGRSSLFGLARDFVGDWEGLSQELSELTETYGDQDDFYLALKQPGLFNEMPPKALRYLLWRYENHLRASQQPVEPPLPHDALSSRDGRLQLTVEHIAPQSGRSIVLDESGVQIERSADFYREYLHLLGNLVIDTRSSNASKGDRAFADKHSQHFDRSTFKSHRELTYFVEGESAWSAGSIESRSEKLYDYALLNAWSIK